MFCQGFFCYTQAYLSHFLQHFYNHILCSSVTETRGILDELFVVEGTVIWKVILIRSLTLNCPLALWNIKSGNFFLWVLFLREIYCLKKSHRFEIWKVAYEAHNIPKISLVHFAYFVFLLSSALSAPINVLLNRQLFTFFRRLEKARHSKSMFQKDSSRKLFFC